jgi:hypothetical protein
VGRTAPRGTRVLEVLALDDVIGREAVQQAFAREALEGPALEPRFDRNAHVVEHPEADASSAAELAVVAQLIDRLEVECDSAVDDVSKSARVRFVPLQTMRSAGTPAVTAACTSPGVFA